MGGPHYVRSNMALTAQLGRVFGGKGARFFTHIRNTDGENVHPVTPLDASGCHRRQCAFGVSRLIAEKETVREWCVGDALVPSMQAGDEGLAAAAAERAPFGVCGASPWKCHAGLDRAGLVQRYWATFNALHRFEPDDGGLVGNAVWPSQCLRSESSGTSHTFPGIARGAAQMLAELVASEAGAPAAAKLRYLMPHSFVLFPLPGCHPLSQLPFGQQGAAA
ncbi:hypothetical protein CKO41_08855 [Thiococcus pfennigii]|nr:hypothetical protein [Thiococcus pfennigii]